MNSNEKKALYSFLSIYIGSAMLLVSVLLYIFYKGEIKSIKETCDMEVSNTSMQIKSDILDAHMNNRKYIPTKVESDHVTYALYDKNKKEVFSNIHENMKVDLSKKTYEQGHHSFYIIKLDEEKVGIKYIVVETCASYVEKNNLKIYILIALVLAAIFIGSIAFLLAKILLKPVREKVEHLDMFIKDSAHELNTPVAVLMTSVSMLKKGKNSEKMMKYIMSSSKQISQIYNDIHFSAFNDLNDDVREKFDLKELVHDSVEFFNDISITKKIEITAILEETIISMDKTKTQKIVNNLISNAIKYSNNNSKVEVSLKNNILCVKDFGIGIDKKEQKEIFKRYKRGVNTEGGFGIGLDIVKKICLEYKLVLKLKSIKDKGSSFYIDFSNIIVKNERY